MNITRIFAACAVASATLLSTATSYAEEIVARLSVHWGPKHHSAIHAKLYADEVNKRAAGKLRIDLFPAGCDGSCRPDSRCVPVLDGSG